MEMTKKRAVGRQSSRRGQRAVHWRVRTHGEHDRREKAPVVKFMQCVLRKDERRAQSRGRKASGSELRQPGRRFRDYHNPKGR
jgi:hypothetical protein